MSLEARFLKTCGRIKELRKELRELEIKEQELMFQIQSQSVCFTTQQRAIINLGRGRTAKEIATKLGIEERTVKFHISRILRRVAGDGYRGSSGDFQKFLNGGFYWRSAEGEK